MNLTNNGQIPFYKISLQAKIKEQELVPVWEKEPGLEVSESGAVLECLSAGETRTLSFYIDPDMDQKSNLELELFAKTENPVLLEKAAEKQLTLQQGKASFTVKKTADCDNASPGETVTYQISIHNTGEVTLHSVVTTERFGLAGVTATFQEQRGITLNKSRTQAKIPEIAPGGCVNLKAKVVLPKDLKDQNLMNQIIVVTDETGEESAVRDQATIRVEDKEKDSSGNGSGNRKWRWNWYRQWEQRWHHNGCVHLSKNRGFFPQRAVSGTDSAFVSFFCCSCKKNVWRQCSTDDP